MTISVHRRANSVHVSDLVYNLVCTRYSVCGTSAFTAIIQYPDDTITPGSYPVLSVIVRVCVRVCTRGVYVYNGDTATCRHFKQWSTAIIYWNLPFSTEFGTGCNCNRFVPGWNKHSLIW